MAEIRIKWRDDEYVIPASRAFQIGEKVEDIARLGEIIEWVKSPKFFKMARCIGEMLRFAGARVSDQEVHAQIISSMDGPEGFHGSVFLLVDLLMGDAPRKGSGGTSEGKPDASSETPSK